MPDRCHHEWGYAPEMNMWKHFAYRCIHCSLLTNISYPNVPMWESAKAIPVERRAPNAHTSRKQKPLSA